MKRRILAGPFFLMAILASVLLWKHGMWAEQPAVILGDAGPVDPRGPVPEPDFILRHADVLALTSMQRSQIGRVVADWKRRAAPWEAEVEAAARRFQATMDQHVVPGRGAGMGPAMHGVMRASRQLARLRMGCWGKAVAVLDGGQRRKLDDLRRTAFSKGGVRP